MDAKLLALKQEKAVTGSHYPNEDFDSSTPPTPPQSFRLLERPADYIVWGLFALANAVGLATHEMWRDELQQWMIALDADGVTSLLANMRFEGVTPLWHLCLFGLSRLTAHPASMQIVRPTIQRRVLFKA